MTAADIGTFAAKAYLNDSAQAFWTNTLLLPAIAKAVLDLQDIIATNQIPFSRKVAAVVDTEAGDEELDAHPTDMLVPISVKDRAVGETYWGNDANEVDELDPNLVSNRVVEWVYNGGLVKINPPTEDRQVRLYYEATLTPVVNVSSVIDITSSQNYLAARTAQLAALTIGNSPTKSAELAPFVVEAEDSLIRILMNNNQGNGVRRRPYGR